MEHFILFTFYLEGATLERDLPWLNTLLKKYSDKFVRVDGNSFVIPIACAYREFCHVVAGCRERDFLFCSVEFDNELMGCFSPEVDAALQKVGIQVKNIAPID